MSFSLECHTVIEASAGTGKTHEMVQLVCRLVVEQGVDLEQILVVTFTEKATGELRGRLRQELQKRLDAAPADRARLQAALDRFDQAHVYTIHGFCQRTLQEFAFENGQEFRAQLVSDPELLETCLREVQRTKWRAEFGDLLPLVLELSDYSSGLHGAAAWESIVRGLAMHYRPCCGQQLHPECIERLAAELQRQETTIQALRQQLCQLAGPADQPENHSWIVGFDRLDYRADWRGSRCRGVLTPLVHWLIRPIAGQTALTDFRKLLDACNTGSFSSHGFRVLTTKLSAKAQKQLADLCPGLTEAVETLEEYRQGFDLDSLRHQLAVWTVKELQARLGEHKRQRGQVSFEDLLTGVATALEQSPSMLLAALREKYRYAIVDEFQDTDQIQWKIFRLIFVEGRTAHRLFVVGDPKQAIYGFLGADLCAYQQAVGLMRKEHAAAYEAQQVNWRSAPELLHGLNRLFGAGNWFADSGIDYLPVGSPPDEERRCFVPEGGDRTSRAALTLVDLSTEEKLRKAGWRMADFIAWEIGRLLYPADGQPTLQMQTKTEPARPICADDICVLVLRRKEAEPLCDALRQASIPYTLYKQAGLWQSAEATHLEYLLRALARPWDSEAFRKALLTRFFRLSPEDLAGTEELPAGHPARELFTGWAILTDERRWGALFQSMLEHSGLLVCELEDNPDGADRARANYQHLCGELARAAYAADLGLLGLLAWLEQKKQQTDDQSDLQPVETDQRRVKIMTIHAAKGLEFPIVFLAGGLTHGPQPVYLSYRNSEKRLVHDIRIHNAAAKQAHDREQEAQERRLLYVALTRAMFKLYLPYLGERKRTGHEGPTATILQPAIEAARLSELSVPWVAMAELPSSRAVQRRSAPAEAVSAESKTATLKVDELFPTLDPNLTQRRIRIHSFSSLHREDQATAQPTYVERPPREEVAARPAPGAELLRGPVFGEMLHDLLETLDFALVGRTVDPAVLLREAKASIEMALESHWLKLPVAVARRPEVRELCREELARLAWQALHTPLPEAGGPLWQVPATDRLHELEFLLPGHVRGVPEGEESFLTGFIDLVFRRAGRYFLVDWKTNTLDSYTPDAIHANMEASDYTMQYRLYLRALASWLKRVQGPAFDFGSSFGGVYYLYVRGLNGKDCSSGVFFHQPEAQEWQS